MEEVKLTGSLETKDRGEVLTRFDMDYVMLCPKSIRKLISYATTDALGIAMPTISANIVGIKTETEVNLNFGTASDAGMTCRGMLLGSAAADAFEITPAVATQQSIYVFAAGR